MRFLVAVALLVLGVAEAHHTPEHTLRGPRFSIGKVHTYDVEWNVTAGIRGLSSQVSKSAFKAQLQIYAKSEKEHILKLIKVYTSGAVEDVDSVNGDVRMQQNRDLEDRLSRPIKFTLENGKITSYTLSTNENLESRKIKKSILRSLEMYVPEYAHKQLESTSSPRIPVSYNVTKASPFGQHTTYYLITVSPNVEFPYHDNVYNITRSEDFGEERYPGHKFHHNFDSQGCPEVCRRDWVNNKYSAGCPAEYEPHQSPLKTYVHHQHHLALENGVMTPEIIESTEVHDAKMYDQDMNVLIRLYLKKVGFRTATLEEPSGRTYSDLEDQETEINTVEIGELCGYKGAREAVEYAKTLLADIAKIIVKGDLEDSQSLIIGEKIILLKQALSKLGVPELEAIAESITRLRSLPSASEDQKVMRQIWMDMLPVIGTESAVSFIVKYIRESVPQNLLMAWEAKEILEALPQNIHTKSEKHIRELRTLLTLQKVQSTHLLHSAVYTCLGRMIGGMCNETETRSSSWSVRQSSQRKQRQSSGRISYGSEECPKALVSEIVKQVSDSLRNSDKKEAIITYIQALAYMGVPEVFPVISEYAYGTAENIQKFSPSYIEFIRTASVFSLHSMAKKHPGSVLKTVKPLFFNETEFPKLRNAAFGVLIRCEPPVELLQHVAVRSWTEKSNEVGSFVTSTLDTYGNSSLPCMFLTSRRIKQVMPMLRRFDRGIQHAKNLLWSYFDDVRDFGLKGHLAYTPSNESIVPSAIYQALTYSKDSLGDTLLQSALHIQGLTESKIIEYIDRRILGIEPPETISQSKEKEIFEEAKIAERIPDELRFTIYKRFFYSTSFYYLDFENLNTQIETLKEYLKAYVVKTSYDYNGHLVKIYLPSTFHTETIALTLPYPIEFQMLQPVVLALKIKSLERNPSLRHFSLAIRPSVYLSKLFTHQIKNMGDCKEVGVYHEHKIAFSYPVEVKFSVEGLKKLSVSYKVPELPKRILYYFTEAGTYAGKKSLTTLPSSENREPIRTLPSPFQYSPEVNIVGLPPFKIDLQLEDTELITELSPRSPLEALHIIVKRVLNAGWRYKAVNITLKDDSTLWPRDTQVTFNIEYNRTHIMKEKLRMNQKQNSAWSRQYSQWSHQDAAWSNQDYPQPTPYFDEQTEDYSRGSEFITESPESDDEDESQWNTERSPQSSWPWPWKKDSKDDEDTGDITGDDWSDDIVRSDMNKNPSAFINIAKRNFAELSKKSHITHDLHVEIETRPVYSNAYIRLQYNHTHSKSHHAFQVEAAVKKQKEHAFRKITLVHYMTFTGKPDEFRYDSQMDKHRARFITALRSHSCECGPWDDLDVLAAGVFYFEPLDSILNNEVASKIEPEYFLSEKHDECIRDVQDGHPMSENCVKAFRERSIFNKLRMAILWDKDLPQAVKRAGWRFDNFFRYIYYNHMTIKYERNLQNMIHFSLDHIDKLVDRPVFDLTIRKPQETIQLRRVKSLGFGLGDPLSSVHDVLGVDLMELTNNTYPPTCVLMKKYVKTYDLRSYPIRLSQCNYVLSTHCSNYKNFAIIAKVLSEDQGTKEIHIHVGPHTLILTPKRGADYKIKYDGRDYTVKDAMVFDEESAEIYVYPETFESDHKHLYVVATRAGIKVTYDGQNVKVQIDPRYKGETCGLCSEFDGETMREFRGIDRCLYSHPDDFVNSAITNRDRCSKQPLYPYHCEREETSRSMVWRRGESTHDEYEPSIKRNIIVLKGNEICFSVHAVPVCEENAHPTETESETMGFHCLPKTDITARRLVSEAKRRSLGELENKSVDYEESVEIAKMCSE